MQPQNRTLIVAEIGTSHGGSVKKAKDLVDAAVAAGADCIKFQWVYASEILHPKTGLVKLPGGEIPLYDRFKELEVEPSFFYIMQSYVKSMGKLFSCSPFGIRSLQELFALKPDYIKIASPELNHYPLLKELVNLELMLPKDQRIPIMLSTGVSILSDIQKAFAILQPLIEPNTNVITLLHCVTSYPAPETEYNLAVIQTLHNLFNVPVGVSDHSLNPTVVPVLGVACGACVIEKHITLSTNDKGLDDPVALNPEDFKKMVKAVHRADTLEMEGLFSECYNEYGEETVEKIIGDGVKHLAHSEKMNYGRTNRSIHVMHDMQVGDYIKKDDIAVLRTEKILNPGMSPEYFESLLGKKIIHAIVAGQGLQQTDVLF
jgi:sialic acid synthase SpsE